VLVVNASGIDRTIAIIGMLLLLLITLAIVAYLAYRQPGSLMGPVVETTDLKAIEFEQISTEVSKTIECLEHDIHGRVEHYLDSGDFSRLIDGLYSALLYASSAIVTGKIDPIFYGNMFEWQDSTKSLRVRYFKGPYNDEIITRYFPLEGPNQGVASKAFHSGEIQVRNSMESELKVPGESRLRSMMSIPIGSSKKSLENGAIVVVNIDSVKEDAFPDPSSKEFEPVQKRAREIVDYVGRVNKLRRRKRIVDFSTKRLATAPDAIAPDGSQVRVLLGLQGGGMAQFQLDPGQVSAAVVHQTVEEIWFFLSGHGEMWRRKEKRQEITTVEAGVCLTIPVGVYFQFRSLGDEALTAIAVTMPSWPGDSEAKIVEGKWEPTIPSH
jgi:mannose-6-phosphate isomerase-like protein (cupin superfamily)